MLVDRSTRIWAMRHDELMVSEAMQGRDAQGGVNAAARGGVPLEGSDFARIVDGIAVVPVRGLLMRQYSYWFWSYEEIMRDVELAQGNSGVKSILLDVDSPGGMAAGVGDCARFISQSGPKPVEAFVGGMAASAAYYIASAAEKITLGSGAMVGSMRVGIKVSR